MPAHGIMGAKVNRGVVERVKVLCLFRNVEVKVSISKDKSWF